VISLIVKSRKLSHDWQFGIAYNAALNFSLFLLEQVEKDFLLMLTIILQSSLFPTSWEKNMTLFQTI